MNKLTTILGILLCTIIFFGVSASPTFAIPPTVTITAPSGQTATGITLNGNFNANSISTTAYFRYWENDPGSCVDAGGTRVPSPVGGTTFADGGSHGFSQAITGLFPNKTYYYCAIGTNTSAQTTYHSTTTSTFSTSNGQTNPCDIPPDTQTAGYTVTAGASCSFPLQPVGANVSLGTVAGMDGGSLTLGSGASLLLLANQTIVFQSITKTGAAINKSPGGVMRKGYIYVKDADNDNFYAANSTTYSASAADGALTGQGYKRRYLITGSSYITQAVDCDDTNAAKNIPSTCAAAGAANNGVTSITATTATLNGTANPNGDAGTRAYFKYGTTNTGECSTLHNTGGASTAAALITGTTSQPFSVGITGLSFGNLYYWCSIVFNNVGTTYSTIGSFVTISAPTAVSSANVTQTTLDVTWTAPTTGANGYRVYRCNRTSVPGCTPTFIATDPNNASPYADSGLTCNTQYAYQVTGTQTAGGTGNEGALSSVYTVTTSSCASAPSVTTSSATSVTGTTATLNGTFTMNGGSSNQYWFRYGTTNTGNCSTLTTATTATAFSSDGAKSTGISSLTGGTPYYFCGVASNSVGTTYGSILTFTTTALLANGSTCTAGSECLSGFCYVDGDSDRYAPSSGTKTCRASSQLGSTGADCDDTKNTVYTGQTAWYGTAIGSGGPKAGTFDYNCSNNNETEKPTTVSNVPWGCTSSCPSSITVPGWRTAAPACGGSTNWITACVRFSDVSCNVNIGNSTSTCTGGSSCYSTGGSTQQRCH